LKLNKARNDFILPERQAVSKYNVHMDFVQIFAVLLDLFAFIRFVDGHIVPNSGM
jgi:hypothetical protein